MHTTCMKVSTCEERRQDNQNSLGEGEARHANIFHHKFYDHHSFYCWGYFFACNNACHYDAMATARYTYKRGLGELNGMKGYPVLVSAQRAQVVYHSKLLYEKCGSELVASIMTVAARARAMVLVTLVLWTTCLETFIGMPCGSGIKMLAKTQGYVAKSGAGFIPALFQGEYSYTSYYSRHAVAIVTSLA